MNDDGTPRLLGTEPRNDGERTGRIVQMLMDLVGVPGKVLAERIGMEPTTLSGKISGRRPWKDTELRPGRRSARLPPGDADPRPRRHHGEPSHSWPVD